MRIIKGIFCLLFIFTFASCATIRDTPVGAAFYHFKDESRYSWFNVSKARPLNTTIWYPAPYGTVERKHNIAIFYTGIYAVKAEINIEDGKHPLIILSHGTGGSSASIAWLAESLAQNGYIVASVNHHGNTGAESRYLLNGFVLWWERAKDISKVIDCILVAIESITHANDSYTDQRIKAAFVIAPVLTPLMNEESLRKIAVPVMIIAGDRDDQSILTENGIPLSQNIPNAGLVVLRDVQHYTFLCEGNLRGRLFAKRYTKDENSIDRKSIHQEVGKLAVEFFDKTL